MNIVNRVVIKTTNTNFISTPLRRVQSNASLLGDCQEVVNRNPRSLEFLTIAKKPVGYHLDVSGHEFWHKVVINKSTRHVNVEILHFKNGPVITASTKEWSLKKQLYKSYDLAAFINLGRVIAQRCLESGITSVYQDNHEENSSVKFQALLEEMQKSGVALKEARWYKNPQSWDRYRPIKPWSILD